MIQTHAIQEAQEIANEENVNMVIFHDPEGFQGEDVEFASESAFDRLFSHVGKNKIITILKPKKVGVTQ
jgi:hypothetical protein